MLVVKADGKKCQMNVRIVGKQFGSPVTVIKTEYLGAHSPIAIISVHVNRSVGQGEFIGTATIQAASARTGRKRGRWWILIQADKLTFCLNCTYWRVRRALGKLIQARGNCAEGRRYTIKGTLRTVRLRRLAIDPLKNNAIVRSESESEYGHSAS